MTTVTMHFFYSILNAPASDTAEGNCRSTFCSMSAQVPCQQNDSKAKSYQRVKKILRNYSEQTLHGKQSSSDLADTVSASDVIPLAGGLQQFLNKNHSVEDVADDSSSTINSNSSSANSQSVPRDCIQQEMSFDDLPPSVQLKIFASLDTRSLCAAAGVSRAWQRVTTDDVMWRKKLRRDMHSWRIISNDTNPEIRMNSDIPYKECYLSCDPSVQQGALEPPSQSLVLRMFSQYFRKPPLIAIFGPGLSASLTRTLYSTSDVCTVKGMFPGQFRGTGSGFTLEDTFGNTFKLTSLHPATRKERESQNNANRLQHNRMLQPQNDDNGEVQERDASGIQIYKATPDIQLLNAAAQGFVYVVDCTMASGEKQEELWSAACSELHSILHPSFCPSSTPVLILALRPDHPGSSLSCVEVVDRLKLSHMTRPWQVRSYCFENVAELKDAFHWIVATAKRQPQK